MKKLIDVAVPNSLDLDTMLELDDLIQKLTKLKEDNITHIELTCEDNYGGFYLGVNTFYRREETDGEVHIREQRALRIENSRIESDKKTLKELLEKYPNLYL